MQSTIDIFSVGLYEQLNRHTLKGKLMSNHTISAQEKIAVIGAGPAGLTAAYELQRAGRKVKIFEASPAVGGMARSFELWNQIVDVGPHRFFSNDPRVNKFWLDAVDHEYVMVNRLTRIYYKKKFFSYPIQAVNALTNLGLYPAFTCILSYIHRKTFPLRDESHFDNWVINRFGSKLYEIFLSHIQRNYGEYLARYWMLTLLRNESKSFHFLKQ